MERTVQQVIKELDCKYNKSEILNNDLIYLTLNGEDMIAGDYFNTVNDYNNFSITISYGVEGDFKILTIRPRKNIKHKYCVNAKCVVVLDLVNSKVLYCVSTIKEFNANTDYTSFLQGPVVFRNKQQYAVTYMDSNIKPTKKLVVTFNQKQHTFTHIKDGVEVIVDVNAKDVMYISHA